MISHETLVPTPSGYTTHGALKPGDKVFSPDGKPVMVLAENPEIIGPTYRLTFNDGETLIAGDQHLWKVRYFDKRRTHEGRVGWTNPVWNTLEVKEYTDRQNLCANPRYLSIPYNDPLILPEADLPVEPYTLGVWLGDGDSRSGRVTNSSDHIWGRIMAAGYEISHDHVPGRSDTRTSTIYGLMPVLRDIGLLADKHIPSQYLRASLRQRTALLQGLMDTDGHVTRKNGACFTTKHKRFAEDFKELIRALGMRPNVAHYRKHLESVGREYEWYEVRFTPRPDVQVFTKPDKVARLEKRKSKWIGRKYIVKVEEIDQIPGKCIQVEGGMYLAGDHYTATHNSTIITFAHTIFEILRSHGDDPYDPEEVTFGIFSHTRPIAKSFLRQIKRELEANKLLQQLYPDILYANPERDAPTWSEDSGIVVRRKLNPKESTVEAHGLVDGQPVGKHFNRLVYDDVVTLKSVASTEMIQKTTDAWALSLNLGTETGKIKHIGTRYHYNDTYKEIIARQTAKVRLYAGTEEGTLDGTPVLLSPEAWRKKVRDMGTYVASCQLLGNPQPESSSNFKEADLRFYRGEAAWEEMNRYIIVDPANKKKKKSDYTSIQAIGLGADGNYYVLAMYRDKLTLNERTDLLMRLHRKYRPLGVYYEEYGMQSDVSHIEYVQERVSYRFDIQTFGGSMAKHDRIRRLLPITEAHRLYLPQTQYRTIYDGTTVDVVERFLENEYKPFPIITDHDDALDCLSRIADPALDLLFPELIDNEYEDPYAYKEPKGSWMAV